MQRNYIDNAIDFFNFYETKEMQTLGANIYLLFHSLAPDGTKDGKLANFIEKNRKILSETDFTQFISQSRFDLKAYLDQIDPDETLEYNNPTTFGECISYLLNKEYFTRISRSYALYFDLKLPLYDDDIRDRLKGRTDTKASYIIDKQFTNWPINQIADSSIYAAAGMNNIHEFNPIGFLYELINCDKQNQSDIHYIVALGQPHFDFFPYFSQPQKYKAKLPNGNEFTVEIDPDFINASSEFSYKYQLFCKITRLENNEIKSVETKTLNLFHINIEDGHTLDLDKHGLNTILDELLLALDNNKGVLVHCRAGLGRTGQMIAQLIALRQNNLESLFESNDHQTILHKLNLFVNKMRKSRPGLIIAPEQLYKAFHNAVTFKQIKKLKEEEALKRQQLFEKMSTELLEKPPEEKSTCASIADTLFKTVQSLSCCASFFWNSCTNAERRSTDTKQENEASRIPQKHNMLH